MNSDTSNHSRVNLILLSLIGPVCALAVWLTSLSFVPVPWPDDSAFYFVAKDLFQWPPRWVMLPQAPFEPTYRIWNFNTMPLYPILIGLGRFVGIDGSFGLKFWPLLFWALSGSFLSVSLYRAGLPALLSALFALALMLDPALRWASVLVRPESLIGFIGIILVVGLSLNRFKRSDSLWDPIAALLAIAAYAHFNAVHLLFAVVPALIFTPRRMIEVGLKTALYLFPWLMTVALKPRLFFHQMELQFRRLDVPNSWLNSPSEAIKSLYQSMGSPEGWPPILEWAAVGIWFLIFAALGAGVIYPIVSRLRKWKGVESLSITREVSLLPAGGWVLGTLWLWHEKPEVWFTYYIHLAVWCFTGLAALKLWLAWANSKNRAFGFSLGSLSALTTVLAGVFLHVNVTQATKLGTSVSWKWETYDALVSCVNQKLIELREKAPKEKPFQVWAPTFPDITIELSRRHPDWQLTRTNDFHDRTHLAIRHGFDVDAVVVTEMINFTERQIDAPWDQHPEVRSVWMDWKDYYLNRLWIAPGWKPNRHVCQHGRWQAFIFSN